MDHNARPGPEVERLLASLACVTRPLTPEQGAPFAALLAELAAGSPSPATVWTAMRAVRDLAASGSPPVPIANITSEWSLELQPLPGLGSSLAVRRDADSTVLRFRLDASGTPRGAITVEGTDDVGFLEIKECPGGLRLQGFAGDRELSVALGEAPAGCWTSKPVVGRLGGEALLALGGGPLVGLFTTRSEAPTGVGRDPGTAGTPVPAAPGPPEPAPPPPASFTLTYRSGPSPFGELSFAGRVVIGRDADCDLQLDDPGVSRHHAAVEPTPAGARVTDLGSSNGTYLNRRRLEAPAEVREGDEIVVGHSYLVLARGHRAVPPVPDVPAPPPAPASVPPAVPLRPPEASSRHCPRCGHAEPDAAMRLCRACGQALGEATPRVVPTCAGCGRELHAGESFCTWCGHKAG